MVYIEKVERLNSVKEYMYIDDKSKGKKKKKTFVHLEETLNTTSDRLVFRLFFSTAYTILDLSEWHGRLMSDKSFFYVLPVPSNLMEHNKQTLECFRYSVALRIYRTWSAYRVILKIWKKIIIIIITMHTWKSFLVLFLDSVPPPWVASEFRSISSNILSQYQYNIG